MATSVTAAIKAAREAYGPLIPADTHTGVQRYTFAYGPELSCIHRLPYRMALAWRKWKIAMHACKAVMARVPDDDSVAYDYFAGDVERRSDDGESLQSIVKSYVGKTGA